MKEVMAFIRVNMVNQTKEALANAGFPAFSCRKCLGRGKKSIDPAVLQTVLENGELPATPVGEHLTEANRLIAKRFFTVIVKDDQVKEVVDAIINANRTGNPGDGKIFILPINEAYTVRTGESTHDAYREEAVTCRKEQECWRNTPHVYIKTEKTTSFSWTKQPDMKSVRIPAPFRAS